MTLEWSPRLKSLTHLILHVTQHIKVWKACFSFLDNQGMKSLIITDNQDFHHVSPYFSNSADDSPDQTDKNRMSSSPTIHHTPLRTSSDYDPPVNRSETINWLNFFEFDSPEKGDGSEDQRVTEATQGKHLVWMRIRLRNRCDLTMRYKSESQHYKDMSNHRLSINWRSGSKKNQLLTSLMTVSVRKTSFTIGVVVCQGTLMSSKRTLMSWGCA